MSKLKDCSWYGLDPAAVNKKFSGNPKFIREFEIAGHTWAVFFCDSPDLTLGHKDYLMLGKSGQQWYVSGRTKEEMQELRYQPAVLCTVCDTVLYSQNTHDYHECGCSNETHVDGGRDYIRYAGMDLSLVKLLTLDLLTGTSFDPDTGEIYTYDGKVD
jgi:hypothetical protein